MTEGEAAEYELPHESWWPMAFGLSVALLGLGLVVPELTIATEEGTLFQDPLAFDPGFGAVRGGTVLLAGLVAFTLSGLGWLREDIEWFEDWVGTGPTLGRWGVLLFIGSEIMIFGALFATYFSFRAGYPTWPPEGTPVEHLPVATTGLNTIILFASGATMHWAHSAIRAGDRKKFKGHLLLTLLLGTVFLAGQVVEYSELIHEGLTLTTHPFGTTFYLLTGTHGLHVLAGLVFIGIVAYRAFVHDQFDPQRHVALEAAAVYWHFVDLVWVFVYAILYLGWV